MKRLLHAGAACLALSLALSLGSCSKSNKPKQLFIFNWTYYTPDSVIQKFEKEYGVKVIYDSFDSNEAMFAKLKAGGSNYDVVFPSADYVSIMVKEGMLARSTNPRSPISRTSIPTSSPARRTTIRTTSSRSPTTWEPPASP